MPNENEKKIEANRSGSETRHMAEQLKLRLPSSLNQRLVRMAGGQKQRAEYVRGLIEDDLNQRGTSTKRIKTDASVNIKTIRWSSSDRDLLKVLHRDMYGLNGRQVALCRDLRTSGADSETRKQTEQLLADLRKVLSQTKLLVELKLEEICQSPDQSP
ncbi:hypothetical protein WNY59_11575 [Ahrensia kielensis]|uniref:Arc-like DNA binding domain-containing protein n=1 Tax=Ahrensia kielensis TaxID=76980 RepID=A0ABU9T7X8_9HYPH